MQDLANELEGALKYRVEQGNFGVPIYTGQGDFEMETPGLVIVATGGPEFPQGSGNFDVRVDCEIRFPADMEDLPAHREKARNALGQLMSDDLAAKLSEEADDLTVFGIKNRECQSGTDENQWISTLSFVAYCCRLDA